MPLSHNCNTIIELNNNRAKMMFFNTATGWTASTEFELLDKPEPKYGKFRFIDDNHGFFTKQTGIIKLLIKLLKANQADDTVKILYNCQEKEDDDPVVQLHVFGRSWYIDIVTYLDLNYRNHFLDEFHDLFGSMIYSNLKTQNGVNVVESDITDLDLYYRLEIGGSSPTAKAEIANYLVNSEVFYNLAARRVSM